MVSKTDSKTTFIKKVGLILIALLFSFVIVACGSQDEFEIVLDKTEIEMFVGETETLTATIDPADATFAPVHWFSYDYDVVTVENGVLEAIAVGTAEVEASIGDVKVKATVTVIEEEVVVEHTVSFFLGGEDDVEGDFPDLTVDDGGKITKPTTDPTREGFVFAGWFANVQGTTPFDFNQAITQDTRVYAKWVLPEYTVTFDLSNLDGEYEEIEPQVIAKGGKVTEPEALTKDNHVFKGWFTDEDLTEEFDFATEVTEDLTLYPKFELVPVTVSFHDGGDAEPFEVIPGQKPDKPANPTKTGFVFEGWFTDATYATAFDFDEVITEDVTVFAKWKVDEEVYTEVTFDLDEGEFIETDIADFKLREFGKTSHKVTFFNNFWGGYTTSILLYDTYYYNQWSRRIGLEQLDNGTFKVALIEEPGTTEQTTESFDYFLVSHDAYLAGYNFIKTLEMGQILTITGIDFDTITTGAINGQINAYPVGFDPELDGSIYLKKGDALPIAKKEGVGFVGWFDEEGNEVTTYDGEKTLTAQWLPTFEVAFVEVNEDYDPDDEESEEFITITKQVIFEGNKVVVPTAPTKTGFVFRGWFADEALTVPFDFKETIVNESFSIYAEWVPTVPTAVDVEAKFDAEAKVWAIAVTPEEEITAEKVLVLKEAGKVLEETKEVDPADVLTFVVADKDGNLTTEAGEYMYEVLREDGSKFIFSFVHDPVNIIGINAEFANFDYNAIWDNSLAAWTIEVVFEDIDNTIDLVQLLAIAGEDLDLPVQVHTDGGNVVFFDVAQEDGDLAFREFGRYTFLVTTRDGEETVFDFYYYPEEVAGITYQVDVDTNGGRIAGGFAQSLFVEKGDDLADLPNPTKSYYEFAGWFKDAALTVAFDKDVAIHEHLTLFAKWTPVEYTITYDTNGGLFPDTYVFADKDEMIVEFLTDLHKFVESEDDLQTFMHGEDNTEGYAGTWEDHKAVVYAGPRPTAQDSESELFIEAYFNKWIYFFDVVHDYVVSVNDTQAFYAESTWVGLIRLSEFVKGERPAHETFPEEYTYDYHNPSTDQYTYESVLKLVEPTRDGYTFAGWFTNPEFEGNSVSTIVVRYGDLDLYAKWTPVETE